MKTSNKFFPILVLLIPCFFCSLISCKNNGGPMTAEAPKSDTVFKERIDTVVVFDPETQVETVQIIKYQDTIVNGVSVGRYPTTNVGGATISH
jgi:hypothetical protein